MTTPESTEAKALAKDYISYWLSIQKDGVSAVSFDTWLGMREALREAQL